MAASYPIQVRIGATDGASGPIRAAAGRISGALSGIGGRISGLTSRLGSAAASAAKVASVAGAAAAAAMVYAGKQLLDNFVETGDELMKFSAQTGISVEKLQELRSAANFSDIETGTFNSGMLTFAKALAKARNETGPLVKGLKKTEPALLAQLKATTSVEEGFLKYVEAMEHAKDEESRLALAGFAFGGAGDDMALLGDTGKAKFEEDMETRRKLGVTSTEAATKAAALADKMDRLGERWMMIKLRIGEAIADAIGPLLEKLGLWYDANRDLINQRIEGTIQAIARAVKAVWEYLKSIDWAAIWAGAKETWDNISAALAKLDAFVQSVFGGWGTAIAVLFGAKALATIATFALAAKAALGAGAAAGAGGATPVGFFGKAANVVSKAFLPLVAAYATGKGIEAMIETVGGTDVVSGTREDGRETHERSAGSSDTWFGQMEAIDASKYAAMYAKLSDQQLANVYAQLEAAAPGSGTQERAALAERGYSNDQVMDLNQAARSKWAAPWWDTVAKQAAEKQVNEIVVRFEGKQPEGMTATVTAAPGDRAKVVARTGARNVGTEAP